jgi:hypothetical protein
MSNFTQIEIDLELFKYIENNRNDFSESSNSILKRKLGLSETENRVLNVKDVKAPGLTSSSREKQSIRMYYKGVPFYEGMRLRKILKGDLHNAIVRNGKIVFKGMSYDSPSAAGMAASGTSVNGWIFWDYYDEKTERWISLDDLRDK